MVSVCLPSDALLQHLPTYLGFSYLERGVSLHGCSSKAQPLLLTLDEGYLLTAAVPDLQRGNTPLGPPVQPSSGCSSWLPALASGVGGSSQLPLLASGSGWLLRVTAPGLGNEVASPGLPLPRMCQENALVIANTLFQQHKRRLYTWTSTDSQQ